MRALVFTAVNVIFFGLLLWTVRKKNFLAFFQDGRWWLTWLSIGIITLMDELTSIYYASFEAYRFIGLRAIVYIALTSLLVRVLSTRMTEIAEILEVNHIKGGGVYSFSYLVLGPSASFVAASSILVSYVLTAATSTSSAVENGTTFIAMSGQAKYFLKFAVVWLIGGLNILGIRENAKFTFIVFVFASFALINLIVGGVLNVTPETLGNIKTGCQLTLSDVKGVSFFSGYANVIAGIGSCILAYSGVESVLQTASFARSWHTIKKAYLFLALSVGIVTPLIALFAIAGTPKIASHPTDLIPEFARLTNGYTFGVIVSVLASLTLIMAVNTAMVASAELIEKIADKYSYSWLTKVNRRRSLYRIHILNAIFYSLIMAVTSGSQQTLAEMYAVGLVASFVINMLALLIYKYAKGTKDISYHTSRVGTLLLFIILVSIFIYIGFNRPTGASLWLVMAGLFLIGGWRIARHRAPEIPVRRITSTPMDVVFAIVGMASDQVHVYLSRPRESVKSADASKSIYVSFYSPRIESPKKEQPNHFWISIQDRATVFDIIRGLLETLSYDVPSEKRIHVHFGWPLSSWLDRLSAGVMVYNMMHLPRKFPQLRFHIDYHSRDK